MGNNFNSGLGSKGKRSKQKKILREEREFTKKSEERGNSSLEEEEV